MASSLLIVGAGYLGTEVARRALVHGFDPIFVGRRRPIPISGVTPIVLDVSDRDALMPLPRVDTIVYAVAAEQHTQASYEKAYAQGLSHVLSVVSGWVSKPHVIFVSSTSVYREETGGFVQEDSQNLVTQGPSAAMVQAERILQNSGIPYSILRFGGIYGPERLYFLNRVRNGAEYLFAGEPIYSNRIHRDDGAAAILHVATHDHCKNRIFNVVDSAPANRNEVVSWLHQRLGLTTPLSMTDDRSLLAVRGNKRCLNSALRESGFTFAYPSFKEGYESLIAHLEGP